MVYHYISILCNFPTTPPTRMMLTFQTNNRSVFKSLKQSAFLTKTAFIVVSQDSTAFNTISLWLINPFPIASLTGVMPIIARSPTFSTGMLVSNFPLARAFPNFIPMSQMIRLVLLSYAFSVLCSPLSLIFSALFNCSHSYIIAPMKS